MSTTTRTAIYARTVTADRSGIERQIAACRRYAGEHDMTVVDVYTDGVAGHTAGVELGHLRDAIKADQLDVVLVWAADRIARHSGILADLIEECVAHDVILRAIDRTLDTSTPLGKLIARQLAAFVTYQHDTHIDRTRTGIARARREGGA